MGTHCQRCVNTRGFTHLKVLRPAKPVGRESFQALGKVPASPMLNSARRPCSIR